MTRKFHSEERTTIAKSGNSETRIILTHNREMWKSLPLTNSRSSVLDDWYKGSTKEIQSEPFLIKLEQGQQTKKKGGGKTQTTVATFPFQWTYNSFKLKPFGFLTQ